MSVIAPVCYVAPGMLPQFKIWDARVIADWPIAPMFGGQAEGGMAPRPVAGTEVSGNTMAAVEP